MAGSEILEILKPGALTSVQDLGRYGCGRFGVAPSGALDGFAHRVGNLLVGNPQNRAGLEAMLLGPSIRALTDVVVSIAGGDLQPQRNGQPITLWRAHKFKKDDILSFKTPRSGFRAYICVAGGIDVPLVMGSRSTNLPTGFGGYQGRPLKKGDILRSEAAAGNSNSAGRALDSRWIPEYSNQWTLRVILGPQDDHFPPESRELFLSAAYAMSPDSDRTGIRLQGPVIPPKADIAESIISEGVVAGSIQIPGDGKPIIILGETVTGGYRKIATVISADLPLLGQIKPGDKVRFEAVSLEASYQALKASEDLIGNIARSLSV
jgi:antagonist of KipI